MLFLYTFGKKSKKNKQIKSTYINVIDTHFLISFKLTYINIFKWFDGNALWSDYGAGMRKIYLQSNALFI